MPRRPKIEVGAARMDLNTRLLALIRLALLSHALGVEDDVMRMAGPGTGNHVPRPPFIDHYLPVIVEHRRNIRGKHVVVRVKTM